MPTFTVLTPHYSEKILLSLREIIREEDQNTRVTLLEYLKQLHPIEWDNFVRDTKILAEESADLDVDEKTDKKTTTSRSTRSASSRPRPSTRCARASGRRSGPRRCTAPCLGS